MNSKKLIEKLKAIDPYGEMDVCFGNIGISQVIADTATREGWYQDVDLESKKAKYSGQGAKIVLSAWSIKDAATHYPGIKVDVIGSDKNGHRENIVTEWTDNNQDIGRPLRRTAVLQEYVPPVDEDDFDPEDDFEDEDDEDN